MEDKCNICKKSIAEVRCTIVIGDELIAQKLCSECARNAGLLEQANIHKKKAHKTTKTPIPKQDTVCPTCKTGYSQFIHLGSFGCPNCYKAFDTKINDILKAIHSATYHRGRKPGQKHNLDIAQLKWSLLGAIEAEDFELAARLRDEISKIEKGKN